MELTHISLQNRCASAHAQAAENKSIKRMLGIIKYNPPRDPDKKGDAEACLALYNSLSDMVEDRKRFVQEFEMNQHKGKDALKFHMNFTKKVVTTERTELGTTSDAYTGIYHQFFLL